MFSHLLFSYIKAILNQTLPNTTRVYKVKHTVEDLFLVIFWVSRFVCFLKNWGERAELQVHMQEMTACRILERVCTHRKFVLINNYSLVCFLYLWLSLFIQHHLHFPADTRHWFQVLAVPLFSLNSWLLFLENFSSPFILPASFPNPSEFLPSIPSWLGFLWIEAVCVAWRQTGFLLWAPVQKCQETW